MTEEEELKARIEAAKKDLSFFSLYWDDIQNTDWISDEELEEATFGFDKFYVQSVHYDDLVKENETLRKNLDAEIAWRTRDD